MSHATGQDATGTRIDRYAAARGEQVATVRKRIQRGHLAAYKGPDHRWYVLEGDATGATRDRTHDATGQDTRQDATGDATGAVVVNSNARAQLEAIRDEWLAPLVAQIAEQAEVIGHLRERTTSQEATIAELRRRAEVAEQEAAALRARPVAPTLPQDEANGDRTTPEPSEAHRGAGDGLWARVRRWWTRDT